MCIKLNERAFGLLMIWIFIVAFARALVVGRLKYPAAIVLLPLGSSLAVKSVTVAWLASQVYLHAGT